MGTCPTGDRAGAPGDSNGTEGSAGSAARFPDWTDRLDVSDGAFAYFDGPVQAVDANEAVAGSHKPLHLDIRALADTEPDEWLRELGRRKIDSLVVEDIVLVHCFVACSALSGNLFHWRLVPVRVQIANAFRKLWMIAGKYQ